MSDGQVVISTSLDEKPIKRGVSNINKTLKGIGGTATKGISNITRGVGTAITATSAAITGFGAASIRAGMDFDSAMSEVEAISGASGSQLEALRDKAKEMGASTKFTATESAEALKYMGMAGWDTQQMLAGLPGVVNLAAASGEDLAMTSDIVTDGLSAFGLQAEEATHFADVLAAASTGANTNVAMLGQTFKYAAPVAGALGYSLEDTALAAGLMANAGIKASTAGTTLRSAMTNMANPTKKMKGAMDDLGLSLTDSNGEMKDLDTVLRETRTAFAGLTEEQKASSAAQIFGKEAMSGMLAVINATDEEYEELSKSINNADGASEKMRKTMEDNLQGAFTNLGSAMEGFKIALFENVNNPMKDTVFNMAESVQKLTKTVESDISKVPDLIGEMVSNMLQKVAEKAPDIIKMGSDIIVSLVEGLRSNSDEIGEALQSIFVAGINGLFEIIPEVVGLLFDLFNTTILENADTLLEAGINILAEIQAGIEEGMPEFIENFSQGIENLALSIALYLPEFLDNGTSIILSLMDGLIEAMPSIIKSMVFILGSLIGSIIDNLPQFLSKGVELVGSIADGIVDNLPLIVATMTNLLSNLISTIASHLPEILGQGVKIVLKLVAGIISNLPEILSAGGKLIGELIKGLASMRGELWNQMKQIMKGVVDRVKEVNLFDLGKNILRGLANGVKSVAGEVWNSITGAIMAPVNWVKKKLKIHSPSRYMRDEIGQWIPAGYAKGIEENIEPVHLAAEDMVEASIPDVRKITPPSVGIEMAQNLAYQTEPVHVKKKRKEQKGNESDGGKFEDMVVLLLEIIANNTDLLKDANKMARLLAQPINRELGTLNRRG